MGQIKWERGVTASMVDFRSADRGSIPLVPAKKLHVTEMSYEDGLLNVMGIWCSGSIRPGGTRDVALVAEVRTLSFPWRFSEKRVGELPGGLMVGRDSLKVQVLVRAQAGQLMMQKLC